MNADTGEIIHNPAAELFRSAVPVAENFSGFSLTPGERDVLTRLENKARGKCNYDPDAVAAEMVARAEQGPLIELRGDPDPDCEECHGKGAAGGGKGNDGKFHPCRCCAMPLIWCNTHNRKATHLREEIGPDRGKPCCDPKLGGIMMPCACVDLTGLVEIDEIK